MAKKGNTGESSKKASGQARKAEAAESKKAEQGRAAASVEDAEWSKGSKDNSKKYVFSSTFLEHEKETFWTVETVGCNSLANSRSKASRSQSLESQD